MYVFQIIYSLDSILMVKFLAIKKACLIQIIKLVQFNNLLDFNKCFVPFFFPLNVIFTKFCLSYEFYFNGLKNLKSMSN